MKNMITMQQNTTIFNAPPSKATAVPEQQQKSYTKASPHTTSMPLNYTQYYDVEMTKHSLSIHITLPLT